VFFCSIGEPTHRVERYKVVFKLDSHFAQIC